MTFAAIGAETQFLMMSAFGGKELAIRTEDFGEVLGGGRRSGAGIIGGFRGRGRGIWRKRRRVWRKRRRVWRKRRTLTVVYWRKLFPFDWSCGIEWLWISCTHPHASSGSCLLAELLGLVGQSQQVGPFGSTHP